MSGDEILKQEIIDKVDIHERNRDRFKLGTGKAGRTIAKIFKFRLIYGGSAYSYAHDSDFMGVSSSERFWQNVIDEYYDKYKGIRKWHNELIEYARKHQCIETPTRTYPITPDWTKREPWPHTIIKNYPVQGFGADMVMLARLEAAKRLRMLGSEDCILVSTIHDSIVADCPRELVGMVGKLLNDSVEAVPDLCKRTFGYEFSLPLTAEVQFGPNKKDMELLTFN